MTCGVHCFYLKIFLANFDMISEVTFLLQKHLQKISIIMKENSKKVLKMTISKNYTFYSTAYIGNIIYIVFYSYFVSLIKYLKNIAKYI